MVKTGKNNKGFSFNAYQGSCMTMLAMNLDARPPKGTFAGFTICYTGPNGVKTPIKNILNFEGTKEIKGSDIAPIQKFNWVHFPGSYSQTGMQMGNYKYEVTPRYLNAAKKLLPLDASLTAAVQDMPVQNFKKGKLSIGFTRAFVKSQAYSNRYGIKQKLLPKLPKDNWMFDTALAAGSNPKYGDFTYEDMYKWLGFNARELVNGMLEEAFHDPSIMVDMFAYDFSDPVVADWCLKLAEAGRIRIIIDNADLHNDDDKGNRSKENIFQEEFEKKAAGISEIFRCSFGRYSHCKEIILKRGNVAYKVLTGSTNFSYTGLYVNANHVLVFEDNDIAGYYSRVFDKCWKVGEAKPFRDSEFATASKTFPAKVPATVFNFSPHTKVYAAALLDEITGFVNKPDNTSVLFSVMEMGETSTGSLIPALRELHENDKIFTYGVTDKSVGSDISLYKPGHKNGILINAKAQGAELPPPFIGEFELGFMHAIHHKFVVINFNGNDPRVYCGSSNLALGGETDNGDNLLCITDPDVATVFAIEAMRLTDHYNFRTLKEKEDDDKKQGIKKPLKLDNTGEWVEKYYDTNDIRCVERNLFA